MKKRPHIGLCDFFFFSTFFPILHFFLSSSSSFVLFLFMNSSRQRGTPRMWQGVRQWAFRCHGISKHCAIPSPYFERCCCHFFLGLSAGFKVDRVEETRRDRSSFLETNLFLFSFSTLPFSLSPSIGRHIETLSRRHFEIERSRGSQKFKMDGNWLPGVKRTWQYHDCTTIIRVEQVLILIIYVYNCK